MNAMQELARRFSLAAASTIFKLGGAFAPKQETDPMQAEKNAGRVYEFEMRTIDGKPKKLSDYRGSALLIVNTASLCGFTPQYKDLQDLYEKHKDRGLKIAAFPANEFGAQEPGTDADIKDLCMTKYAVAFDLYSKIVVKGGAHLPAPHQGRLSRRHPWNFSKF